MNKPVNEDFSLAVDRGAVGTISPVKGKPGVYHAHDAGGESRAPRRREPSLREQHQAAYAEVEELTDLLQRLVPGGNGFVHTERRLAEAKERLERIRFFVEDKEPSPPPVNERIREINRRNAEFWRRPE